MNPLFWADEFTQHICDGVIRAHSGSFVLTSFKLRITGGISIFVTRELWCHNFIDWFSSINPARAGNWVSVNVSEPDDNNDTPTMNCLFAFNNINRRDGCGHKGHSIYVLLLCVNGSMTRGRVFNQIQWTFNPHLFSWGFPFCIRCELY